MRKAVSKRIKFTKNGILVHRTAGQNHFNAKSSRKSQLRKKLGSRFSATWSKKIKRYL